MADRKKVIEGLKELQSHFRAMAGIASSKQGRANHIESAKTIGDALALLRAQEQTSEQDRKDLEILRRVRDGKLAKALCHDYVIYNGEWYRNHKWDWPENEPLEPRIIDGEPECGYCLYELRRDADSYCPCCGRKIKWE